MYIYINIYVYVYVYGYGYGYVYVYVYVYVYIYVMYIFIYCHYAPNEKGAISGFGLDPTLLPSFEHIPSLQHRRGNSTLTIEVNAAKKRRLVQKVAWHERFT